MNAALEVAKWLTGRWWGKPLGWLIYAATFAIAAALLLAGAAVLLSLAGGILYGVGWVLLSSNPLSSGLFAAAAVLGVIAAALWWSVDHEGKGIGVAVLAVAVGIAWFVSIPGEKPEPGSRAAFCETHECIGRFEEGRGYRVQCDDGMWSQSGGIQGACSGHGGVR